MLVRNTTFEKNLKPEDFDLRIWDVMYDRTRILSCRNNVPTFWRAARIKRVRGHPHRHFGHVLRPPTPMFGPLGEPLKPGNKDFIRSLVDLFLITH